MTAELADMKRISLGRRVDRDPLDSIIQHMPIIGPFRPIIRSTVLLICPRRSTTSGMGV